MRGVIFGLVVLALASPAVAQETPPGVLDALIAAHAKTNGVPESLVRQVIKRESRYNPGAVGRGGAMGLMQIKHATARALGYTGTAAGLLDPATNLTYAVRYLAGALRAAEGNVERGLLNYRTGYYQRRKGRSPASAQAAARVPGAGEGAAVKPGAARDAAAPPLRPGFIP
jgi:soluble lytic murein transglycosylase-like protein